MSLKKYNNYKGVGSYIIIISLLLAISCGGGSGGGGGNVTPSVTLASLTVLPTIPTVSVDTTVQFRAVGTYADNSTQDLANQVTWHSSNEDVATISNTGLAAVVGPGTTTISAVSGLLSASATLTGTSIPPVALTALSLYPALRSAVVGTTVQFSAIGTYSDNSTQDLTNQVTWGSTNTAVATIRNPGIAAVLSAGTTTISAASGLLSANATLIGTSIPPAKPTALTVSPALQSAVVGTTVQFSAIGTYSDNSTQDLSNQVTWNSSNTAVATINGTGIATVVSAGTTTISAASGSLSAGAILTGTVPQATLASLSVLPATPSAAIGATVQFRAVGTYSDNSMQDLTNQVTWSSLNTAVATINGTGFATVVSAGTTTIRAASGSLSAGATLTGIIPQATLTSMTVLPATPSAAIGATVQLQAVGTYADNSAKDLSNQVTWSSSNEAVATITSTGLAAVVGSGITTVSAASGAVSASATLTALGSANVLLYVTDNIEDYLQVIATFNKIRLVSTSAGVICDVLSPPITLDIANLANIMQLSALSTCPAAKYNRIDLEFAQSVQLMDSAENTSSCLFVSYLNDADNPNALQCDPTTNTCTLTIPGAVRSGAFDLLSTQVNKLALDFDLKKFTVQGFGDPVNCSMAMKVVPLHDADIIQKGNPEVIAGSISKLDTVAQTFTLTRGNVKNTVSYATIVNADHPGIDALLQTAQANGIRVTVSSADLGGLKTKTVIASDISLKLEGTISNVTKKAQVYTFALTYDSAKTMTILSAPPTGKKHGKLADGAWVQVQLYGYDSAQSVYLSSLVSVQKSGTKTDN
jgi:hypothetical protein